MKEYVHARVAVRLALTNGEENMHIVVTYRIAPKKSMDLKKFVIISAQVESDKYMKEYE